MYPGLTGILFFVPLQGGDGDYPHGWNYWLVQLFCLQDLYLCLSHGGPAAARGLSLRALVRSLRPHLRLLSGLWGTPGGQKENPSLERGLGPETAANNRLVMLS